MPRSSSTAACCGYYYIHGLPRSGDIAPLATLTEHIQHDARVQINRLRCPQRNIIIIIITTISSIVMCHLIATSSNLHAAAMALYEVLLLRGHPTMHLGVRRQALVRGRNRAAAMARQWALDERNWYADDSPCWVTYGRAMHIPLQDARYEFERPWELPMGWRTLVRSTPRVVHEGHDDGRIAIIEFHQELQPWVARFHEHRRPREMRAITMHMRSCSR